MSSEKVGMAFSTLVVAQSSLDCAICPKIVSESWMSQLMEWTAGVWGKCIEKEPPVRGHMVLYGSVHGLGGPHTLKLPLS